MSVLRFLPLLIIIGLVFPTHAHAQQVEIPSVAISGAYLPHGVELAPADADAFRRRLNLLPRLQVPPAYSGPVFIVKTSYWQDAVPLQGNEDYQDVSMNGVYYPHGGYVHVVLGSKNVWLVLSLRQRAILDRYIRLDEAGLIGEAPSTIDVLAAASKSETFGVQVDNTNLQPSQAAGLLTTLAKANPEPAVSPREPVASTGNGLWLIVTLVEGRELRYYYDGKTLTEALGTERYDASSVAPVFDSISTANEPFIHQEKPAGSLLWWPVMLGGGFLSIGIALWLQRRNVASR